MPSENEVSIAKETLLDYSRKLGDEIVEENPFQEDDGNLIGFTAADETYSAYYNVFGSPNFEFFQIMFRFSLSNAMLNRMDEEAIDDLIEEDEPKEKAGDRLINKQDVGEINWLRYHLRQVSMNSNTFVEIDTTEEGRMNGFSVFSLVFPYEDGFSFSDYYDVAAAVLNTGQKGSEYLQQAIEVTTEEEDGVSLKIRM